MNDQDVDVDLATVRDLLRKYGPRMFGIMVQAATASLRDSTVSSSARSFASTTTSASRTTASSLSCYTDSGSGGLGMGGQLPWCPPNAALRANFSRTSTPVDPSPVDSMSLHSNSMPQSQMKELEHEVPGDGAKSKLQCPFCAEFGIDMRIGRKPDLKRHFNKIHATNKQWICKFNIGGGCNLFFDFSSAYEAHVKQDHGGTRDPDAKVNLCQQVVFACGFEKCRDVFEAETDHDGPDTLNSYFEHVLTHVTSSSSDSWSYSRRIRNLLQQHRIRAAWKQCYSEWKGCDKGNGRDLLWYPQSSGILRKMLECRHIPDVSILCRYAVLLGDPKRPAPALPPSGFETPALNTCTMISPCHDPDQDIRSPKGGVKGRKRVIHRISDNQLARVPVLHSSPAHAGMSPIGQQQELFYQEIFQPNPTSIPFGTSSILSTSFSMGNVEAVAMPQYQQPHPLELFAGSESLGEPPSQHQVITDIENSLGVPGIAGRHKGPGKLHSFSKSFERLRSKRTSSPDPDCHMGGSSPPMPTVFPAHQHAAVARRRSSGAMDATFFSAAMPQ